MKRKYFLIFLKNYIRKELRVMTVKMIQNHKKNGVQKEIEKIQEMFN